jgi:ubiquinone/menaquinone biosynthesis C-methylase UbiE
MTVSDPGLYLDRDNLRTNAYADPGKLSRRMAIYEFQNPRHDLRVHVREFLRDAGGPLLDVGCGAGAYTRMLRDAHPGTTVVAADLSAGMATAAGSPAVVSDATALPFRDAAFGGVIALHMLYHVPEPPAAIEEMRRVLRPGGTLVISTNAYGDKAALREVHSRAAAEVGVAIPSIGPSMRFHLDGAETLLRRYFDTVERVDLESVVTVPYADPVVSFIDSTRSFYGSGPEVMPPVRRIVEEIIEHEGAVTFRTHSGFLVCR